MSSAKYIAYEIRPSKQVERRIILDLCQACRQAGFDLPTYRYLGFGGIKYIDFLLFHRYIGFAEMVSVEFDQGIIERCRLNKPFSSLRLVEGELSAYIRENGADQKCVAWLDYDGVLSPDVQEDLTECGTRLPGGSLLFVTVNAEPPRRYRKAKASQRREFMTEDFGHFASDLEEKDFENNRFRISVGIVLSRILQNGFAARHPTAFIPILRCLYKDTAWMCTIGGLVGDPAAADTRAALDLIERRMGTLAPSREDEFFQVPQVNITEIERQILDRAVTDGRRNSKERNRARALGFNDDFLEAYRQIVRFVPRYVEAAI